MNVVVQKYGGTSVATVERIRAVAGHIATCLAADASQRLVVAVSAMGDHTDELLALAHQVCKDPPGRETDMLLSVGERITMALLSMALHEKDIRSLSLTGSQSGILTDEHHGTARIQRILGDRIKSGLAEDKVVIVAGFQGMCLETKEITTLGRGGTDLTAIALASALQARRCEIYKDVDGIFTTDPRVVAGARKIDHMSWDSLLALTWSGANVVHARGAHIAKKFQIPLEIRSSFNLERRGTFIKAEALVESITLSAMTHKKEQALLTVTYRASQTLLADSLSWLWKKGETPIIAQEALTEAGENCLKLIFSAKLVPAFQSFVDTLLPAIRGKLTSFQAKNGLGTISVIGEGFWQSPETLTKILKALPCSPVVFESKNSAVSMAIPEPMLDDALARVHAVLFESEAPRQTP